MVYGLRNQRMIYGVYPAGKRVFIFICIQHYEHFQNLFLTLHEMY